MKLQKINLYSERVYGPQGSLFFLEITPLYWNSSCSLPEKSSCIEVKVAEKWYSNPVSAVVPYMFLMETLKDELQYHFPMHQQGYKVETNKQTKLFHSLKIYLNPKFQINIRICHSIVIKNSLHIFPVKVTDKCVLPEIQGAFRVPYLYQQSCKKIHNVKGTPSIH